MRLKPALVAVAATLSALLVAPSPAQAAPDSIACSAAGSYSRVIGSTAYTFWLVGTTGSYRYWHAEWLAGSTPYYNRSYVVLCSGSAIIWSADLVPITNVPERCNPQTTLTYRHIGVRETRPFVGAVFPRPYHYWHVMRYVPTFPVGYFVYDHSEVAAC
jgi:hypothetical protein